MPSVCCVVILPHCRQVSVVGPKVNPGLIQQGGIQAQVPTKARVQSPEKLDFAATGSVDAVVLVREFGDLNGSQGASFLNEVARILKPGSPLVFVEQGELGLICRTAPLCLLCDLASSRGPPSLKGEKT